MGRRMKKVVWMVTVGSLPIKSTYRAALHVAYKIGTPLLLVP
jgi:hypothetical protein